MSSGNGLNSGYVATDQRRPRVGVVNGRKDYLEKLYAAANLWTPAQLTTTTLWLDANDSTTVTSSLVGSNLEVHNWRDKSGFDRHVTQSSTISRPYYVTSTWGNQLRVLRFDGTNDFMVGSVAISNIITSIRYSAFVVGMATSITDSNILPDREDAFWSDDGGWRGIYLTGSANPSVGGYNYSGGNVPFTATTSYTLSSGSVMGMQMNIDTVSFRLNGNTEVLSSTFTPTGIVANNFQVGRNWNINTACLNGEIGEVILTNTVLPQVDRQRVEGYLAHKWGLVASLPSTHPYKIDPPLIYYQ